MSIGRDGVSELRPPTGQFFIPQMTYWYEEPWWKESTGKSNNNNNINNNNNNPEGSHLHTRRRENLKYHSHISNFTKMRLIILELIPADRQTDVKAKLRGYVCKLYCEFI
jgi:hypothetical protein